MKLTPEEKDFLIRICNNKPSQTTNKFNNRFDNNITKYEISEKNRKFLRNIISNDLYISGIEHKEKLEYPVTRWNLNR